MNETKKIYSLSINGRITLNLHSLNNEGSEGNQLLTREVTVVDENGELATVNAISGDMMKHIQAEHLFHIAKGDNLSLCKGCEMFNANRISGDKEFIGTFDKSTPDTQVLTNMLRKCTVDDLEGILITNKNKNIPRKSIVEFGWVVGLPKKTKTESFFHVKYVKDSGMTENSEGSNLGQSIFYRPANSGIYAIVGNLDICRIGYNDISKTYAIEDNERQDRYKALLKSLLYTFLKPTGAHRNTQNPHIVNFEGVVSISTSTIPAPTVSPLKQNYGDDIKEITKNLNEIETGAIELFEFRDMAEFSQRMKDILKTTAPAKL